jgi:G:T-mismatch repair DNA endonuclease (very short patch repair protein)
MDNLTPAQRKKNMQNIHAEGTLPEKIIISELKKTGYIFLLMRRIFLVNLI